MATKKTLKKKAGKKQMAAKKKTAKLKEAKPIKAVAKPPKKKASDLIRKYRRDAKDTGSTEVQIAVLSERIEDLSSHLKQHPKDFDSRRGLLMLVSKRRRLLNYLRRTDELQYQEMVADLKLLQ